GGGGGGARGRWPGTGAAGIDVYLRRGRCAAGRTLTGEPARPPLASLAVGTRRKVDPEEPGVPPPAHVLGRPNHPLKCPADPGPNALCPILCPRPYKGIVTRTPIGSLHPFCDQQFSPVSEGGLGGLLHGSAEAHPGP